MDFPLGYSDQSLAEKLANKLHADVMMRGIHPGHCAVVFDGDATAELFPTPNSGLPSFVQLVNEWLRAIPARNQAGHMLQISQNIDETLLYSGSLRATSYRRGLSATPASAVANAPLLCEAHGGADGEATAAYKMERHAEVEN